MNNKTNIEEDIKTLKDFVFIWKDHRLPIITDYNIQAIENILADRERLEAKANKYDSLIEKIKEKIILHKEYLQNQAVTSNPTLDAHYRNIEKQIIQTLQELLEELKEEK